jgi:predicted TPR repeat methyltransferase
MLTVLQSSGDLSADRRYAWADALLAEGDAAGAAALLAETTLMVPDWPPVWVRLGDAYAADGACGAAADAYRVAVGLDPSDVLGAALKLARLGAADAPPAPPPAHVGALFDAFAARFEETLVGALDYRAPGLLAALVDRCRGGGAEPRFGTALDLGCGTGLVGPLVRPWCGRLVGIDLSSAMLAEAERKGVYDALAAGEAVALLDEGRAPLAGPFDLVITADVLCYLGDLAPLFAAVARRLAPGGLLAVTTERAGDGEADATGWALRETMRYAHRDDLVDRAAAAAGLAPIAREHAVLRLDRGAPIAGTVHVFAASRPDGEAAVPLSE